MNEPTAPKPPSSHTVEANAAVGADLALDPADFERASRNKVAELATGQIESERRTVWDLDAHDFVRSQEQAPTSVNPSLWRQARLNCIHGLFQVADGVWQARGYDLSNITFIAGDTGWLVIDPLTSATTAAACLQLANDTLGKRPVTAVIYTHSHVDHFGGVLGVTSQADVDAGDVRVIAPEHFLHEAVFENVIAGPVMGRRAGFMYGGLIPPGPQGHVDAGLGKIVPRSGIGLIAPTEDITATGQELTVDGIHMVFQNTPDAEAPAEMNFHFPDKRLLCMAENCSHNMHNLYTPRGAQVRNALAWSKYINEAKELFGDQTDTLFASHHWPRFGAEDAGEFLSTQRDLYRWLHDQTMRWANKGFTPMEIAEQLELPECFAVHGHCREYYGTVSHNAKAVYQRYLGWFDGNPANLNPLPPTDAATRYVEFMGGADEVLTKAQAAFDAGDYRWVAQVVNHVVFAEPTNRAARQLQADALEQMGYQAESGPWRNFYLTGAQELRQGAPESSGAPTGAGVLGALSVSLIFDALAVRVMGDEAAGKKITINWRFTDIDEDHVLGLENCALHHTPGRHDPSATLTVIMTKETLAQVIAGRANFVEEATEGRVTLDGDADALVEIFGLLDTFEPFNIIEP